MASKKLTDYGHNAKTVVIVSLLRHMYETLHVTSLQRLSRALHLALFA